MGIYGYCVVPRAHGPPAALSGIDGAGVTMLELGELGVWVSEIARPQPDIAHVQAHNDVVEAALSEAVTPVPLRFGQWAEQADVFERVIAEKAEWYRERLAAFAGALEFGLRVAAPEKPDPARLVHPRATTGLEYMNALRANAESTQLKRGEEERIRAGIAEVMGGLVREERVDEPNTPRGIVTVSHLVARERFDEYREHVQMLRKQYPELRFLVSGPWVPYSFSA